MIAESSTPGSPEFASNVQSRVAAGARFAGLFASPRGADTRLLAVLIEHDRLVTESFTVRAPAHAYPSLSTSLPGAAWYERELHDLFGLESEQTDAAHALIFPFPAGTQRPRPGALGDRIPVEPDLTPLPVHLHGEGVFTMSYGPVRSGVFESIEYLVETPGEDIPYLRTRVFYKHRGVEVGFERLSLGDGVLMAERAEGVASVAHALAYCGALERLAHTDVPVGAALVRVVHAELERVANHLDSTIRHTEGAGQAVAYARFSAHKERVQRIRARLCGSRFGRGVVVPGGVRAAPGLDAEELLTLIGELSHAIDLDFKLLMTTPSFLDRLRNTGVISCELARRFGALGPIARASGLPEDARFSRPYAAYDHLGRVPMPARTEGDALARQRVRIDEITQSFHLLRQAADLLTSLEGDQLTWSVPVEPADGEAIGWAEAPQGEVLYLVEVQDGRLTRVKPRSASFQNLALFPLAFPKDILTDFAFIEASFGLSIAGVAL